MPHSQYVTALLVLKRATRPKHRADARIARLRTSIGEMLKDAQERHQERDFSQVQLLLAEFDRIAQERLYDGRLRRYARAIQSLNEAVLELASLDEQLQMQEEIEYEVDGAVARKGNRPPARLRRSS